MTRNELRTAPTPNLETSGQVDATLVSIKQLEELLIQEPAETRFMLATRIRKAGEVLHRLLKPKDVAGSCEFYPGVTEEKDIFGDENKLKISGIIPDEENDQQQRAIFIESTHDSFTLRGFSRNVSNGEKIKESSYDIKFEYIGENESDLALKVFGEALYHREVMHTIYPTRFKEGESYNYTGTLDFVNKYFEIGITDFVSYLKTRASNTAADSTLRAS